MIRQRFPRLLALFVVITLFCTLERAATLFAQDTIVAFDLERIERATVFILQTRDAAGIPVITCVSSGTFVSRDGLIVTNAHSTVAGRDCSGNRLIVALNVRDGDSPVPMFQAEVAQYDLGLDLALLQVTREMDGRIINKETLSLPFVELADSSQLTLDDTITVVGYPGIGNDPVQAVRGTIQGFTYEPSSDLPTWAKVRTDVASGESIAGTMSGGGAYNRQGLLVGIPTTAPLSRDNVGAICNYIEDTNRDSLVNANDNCVPTGGAINALRPSNFARPLIRSGSLGLVVEKLTEPPAPLNLTVETPSISNLFFAPFETSGMPTTVIERLPTGSDGLYLFFDYANMTPETIYELRVTIDGNISPVFSLAPVRWSGRQRGLWYIGSSGQIWPDGVYEFTVFINGVAAAPTISITIGGAPDARPTFRNLTFGLPGNEFVTDGNAALFGLGYVIPTGQIVAARFSFDNIQQGTPWAAIWYYDGAEQARVESGWESDGASGSDTISLEDPNGLPEGQYRLSLYLDGQLAVLSDFLMIGTRADAFPRVFTNERFVIADSPQNALTARPMTSSTDRVPSLYTLFDWERIAPNTLWQMRWSVDGTPFYDQLVPWRGAGSGQNFVTVLTGTDGVPDGTYRMELLINRVPIVSIEADIGIGQLPIDLLAQAEGVLLRGQILNADTNVGVPGVSLLLLSEQFSVEDFESRSDQLYAMTTTDRQGRFQFNRPLAYDAPYSIIITAEGFLPLTADGFQMTEDNPNPFDMTIYLTRD